MQVSHLRELDTHAVIGGGQAQAFGIAETAEFFTVLSDTLYRDKKRAVVREVICNAWDAHIAAGITDRPVEITLTDEELIIKDFGPGIAHDKIGPIYCVYGASTKIKDENQTGGFGLGCKAPFAYSHHFSVTSCHKGFRTIYAISRGGSETGGRPDFRAMVRTKTEETGITVSVPLKDKADRIEFANIVRSVVEQGGMLATLNDDALPRIDYTEARKTGFAIVPSFQHNLHESSTYILYGTVLYPLTTTDDDLMQRNDELHGVLENNVVAILVAPPNSIGITPSREALSYSDLTTKTLHRLLKRMTHQIRQNIPAGLRRHVVDRVANMNRYQLSTRGINLKRTWNEKIITDPTEIAFRAASERGSVLVSDKCLFKLVKQAMVKRFPEDRRQVRRLQNDCFWSQKNRWIPLNHARHSVRLFLRMAARLDLLNAVAITTTDYRSVDTRMRRATRREIIKGALPVLVIAPTQQSAVTRYARWWADQEDTKLRQESHTLVAFILPKPAESQVNEIKRLAKHYEIEVLEAKRVVVPKTKRVVAPVKFFDLATYNKIVIKGKEPEPDLDTAPIYIRTTGPVANPRFPTGVLHARKRIVELYPTVAIALNAEQERRLIKDGAVNFFKIVLDELRVLSKAREVRYALLAHNKLFLTDHVRYDSAGELASVFAKMNLEAAKLLFPARVTITDKSVRAIKLLEILNLTFDRYDFTSENELRKEWNKLHEKMLSKAKEIFASIRVAPGEAEKRFAYLKAIRSNCEDQDLVFDLIRFAQRRAKQISRRKNHKSTMTDDLNNAIKEAA